MDTCLIKQIKNEPRVSHRIIAENTGNEARSVYRIINENKSDFEEFGVLRFEITKPLAVGGRPQKTYYLNEAQATLLLTFLRNSEIVVKFKVALVKAFYELKNKQAQALPKTYKEALIDLVQKVEKIELLEKEKETNKPLVEFAKAVGESCDTLSIRDFAKVLNSKNFNIGEKRLFELLRSWGYLTQDNKPKQRFIDQGLFELKEKIYKKQGDLTPRLYLQTRITPKGQRYFIKVLWGDDDPYLAKAA